MMILICCSLIISDVEHPSLYFFFLFFFLVGVGVGVGWGSKDGDKNHSVLMLIPVIAVLRLALF